MSKHSIAKELLAALESRSAAESIDRNEAVEALLTLCVQDMKESRGASFTRDYVQYEMDSLGSGGVFEIQRR